jgi:hypothetical protein
MNEELVSVGPPVSHITFIGTFTQEQANARDKQKLLDEHAEQFAHSQAVAELDVAKQRLDEALQRKEAAELALKSLANRRASLVQAIEGAKRLLEWAENSIKEDPKNFLEEAFGASESYHAWEDPPARTKISDYIAALSRYEATRFFFGKLKERWTLKLTALETELGQVEKELLPKEPKTK